MDLEGAGAEAGVAAEARESGEAARAAAAFRTNRDYLLDLLARGVPAAQAAQLASVSVSRVSQLLVEPEFREALERLRAVKLQDRTERERRAAKVHGMYLDLEEQLLADLQRNVLAMRTHDKIKLLNTLAGKKPPAPSIAAGESGTGSGGPAHVVAISLPQIAASAFVMDQHKNIIGVQNSQGEEISLIPMSGRALRDAMKEGLKEEMKLHEAVNANEPEEIREGPLAGTVGIDRTNAQRAASAVPVKCATSTATDVMKFFQNRALGAAAGASGKKA